MYGWMKYKHNNSLAICCVTGNIYNKQDMIKLVISENDGLLYFDPKHSLKGESFFLTNSKSIVTKFLQKGISGEDSSDIIKELNKRLVVWENTNLGEKIEKFYLTQMLSLISLAKKAGNLIIGKEKISNDLQKAGIIIQAHDASHREKFSPSGRIMVCEVFDIAQLSKACGKENVRFLLITNQIAESFKKFYDKYNCYLIG